MHKDRPFLGILLMLAFCVLAPLGDSIGKYLSPTVPLLQLVLVRFAVQAVVLFPIVWASRRPVRMNSRITGLTVLRTALHIVGVGTMFMSLRYLPLADAIAIAFVMPFIMLLLGKTILNEEVGRHRLAACAVGFVGTLLVIQPNFSSVGWPALLPLIVAVDFAFFMLVTRQIAKDVDPISLQALSGLMAIFILLPAAYFTGMLDGEIVSTGIGRNWALLILLGLVGTIAHLFMTWSLRFAPSATLAPMQYLEIPFATLIGWLVFSDLPNGLAAVGIMVTVAAGLYVIMRERLIARTAPVSSQPKSHAE